MKRITEELSQHLQHKTTNIVLKGRPGIVELVEESEHLRDEGRALRKENTRLKTESQKKDQALKTLQRKCVELEHQLSRHSVKHEPINEYDILH